MTSTRPRLTVRRLMIAVALAGVALGGLGLLQRRRDHARSMALRHGSAFHEVMGSWEALTDFGRVKRFADYHLEREARWSEAARRPWLPFEADPPEPGAPGSATVVEEALLELPSPP